MANKRKSSISLTDAFPIKTASPVPSSTSSGRPKYQPASKKAIGSNYQPYYTIDENKLNLAIIFNHIHFNLHPQFENPGTRWGADQDSKNIANTLTALNFTVKTYEDLTLDKLNEVVIYLSKQSNSTINCIILIVMTHGYEDDILYNKDMTRGYDNYMLYANDIAYSINNLIRPFTKPESKLKGVPKLFFIQACRGIRLDMGVECDGDVSENIPTTADILIMNSTIEGYVSWRESEGSWFIQTLAKQLLEHWNDYDLLKILTRVNHIIAYKFQAKTHHADTDKAKQVSEFSSTLTKLLKIETAYEEGSSQKKKCIAKFHKMLPV